jgi:hypothetical protein
MPGQRGISARRSRGSWAVRIAGIALAVFAAATVAGVLVFTQGTARAKKHPHAPPPPPRNVVSVLTVALVNPGPPPRPDSHPVPEMLQESATGLAFTATGGAGQASGQEWTADQMGGGTYIFIYVPDGRCLTAPASVLRHRHGRTGRLAAAQRRGRAVPDGRDPGARQPARRIRRGPARVHRAGGMAADHFVYDGVLTTLTVY